MADSDSVGECLISILAFSLAGMLAILTPVNSEFTAGESGFPVRTLALDVLPGGYWL
jgi:hypothetical protein